MSTNRQTCVARILCGLWMLTAPTFAAGEEVWHVLTPVAAQERQGSFDEAKTTKILADGSVQANLPAPAASFLTMWFQCQRVTAINHIRVEILTDLRFRDNRRGRNPDRERLMLFDIEARLPDAKQIFRRIEWQSCEVSADADDPVNTDGHYLIDALSDTGWSIPRFALTTAPPTAILTLPETIQIRPGGQLSLSFDIGGAPNLDTPARYRISYASD